MNRTPFRYGGRFLAAVASENVTEKGVRDQSAIIAVNPR